MALIVKDDRELLLRLIEEHGPFLDGSSALARRAIRADFDKIRHASWPTTAAGHKQRARLGVKILRRVAILSFGGEDAVNELLESLPLLRPPSSGQVRGLPGHVQAAISIINRLVALVEDLYSGDEAARRRLLKRGRAELHRLTRGEYDYLCPRIDVAAEALATVDLPFVVLPPGARIQSFVRKLQSSGHYRDREEDANRRGVIEDLWDHFGSSRCTLYRSVFQPSEDGNGYLVIAVAQVDGNEHAVAISPWKGEHATFVVRSDCGKREPWQTVLGRSKTDAKNAGAKRLVFTASADGNLDQYEAMKRKIICLIDCTPVEFEDGQFVFDQSGDRYVRRVRVSSSAKSPRPTAPSKAQRCARQQALPSRPDRLPRPTPPVRPVPPSRVTPPSPTSPVRPAPPSRVAPPSRPTTSSRLNRPARPDLPAQGVEAGPPKAFRVNAIRVSSTPRTVPGAPKAVIEQPAVPVARLGLWRRFLIWLRNS